MVYDSLHELSRALLFMYTGVNVEARVIASKHGANGGVRQGTRFDGTAIIWGNGVHGGQKARTNGNGDFSPDVKWTLCCVSASASVSASGRGVACVF